MTLERCPGCRVRLPQAPTCPRCGCDLTLVRRAEVQARQLIVRAVHAWARGKHEEARGCARAASVLHNSWLATGVLRGLGPPRGGDIGQSNRDGAAQAQP